MSRIYRTAESILFSPTNKTSAINSSRSLLVFLNNFQDVSVHDRYCLRRVDAMFHIKMFNEVIT